VKTMTKKPMKVLLLEPPISPGQGSDLSRVFKESLSYSSPDSPHKVEALFHALSFQEADQLFEREHPDVILLHLDRAGLECFDFCQNIRAHEQDRHTGIIFVSYQAQGDDRLLERVLEHGGDDLIDERVSDREILARVNSVYRFKTMADRLRSANHRLKVLSLTDELTGLSNMRAFHIDYQRLLKACRKGETGLGILMLDLDHFKSVNDNANHLVGSFVIGEVGRLMLHSGILGSDAVAARYGGDEYIIAVPSNSIKVLWDMAERLKDLILKSVFKKDQFTIKLTASFGVSWVDPGFEGKSDDLIKAADVMLYRSKRLGRNRVNGMILRYPVDFNHVGRPHLVDRESLFGAETEAREDEPDALVASLQGGT
jgi:two-component system cell cycle response regulator